METEQANLEYPYDSAPPYGTLKEVAPGVYVAVPVIRDLRAKAFVRSLSGYGTVKSAR